MTRPMTRPTTTWPATARAFLLDDDAGAAVDVLAGELSRHDVSRSALRGGRRLTAPACRAVDHEVAAVAADLLEVDLLRVLASAWRKYAELTLAAQRTLAVPGSEELVVMATHQVAWACGPAVRLLVDGKQVAAVELDARVAFDLQGVIAVIRRGDLVALRAGACALEGTLTAARQPLAHRRRCVNLPHVVAIDPPIPLVGEAAGHAGQARPVGRHRGTPA
jgi:hypothetical protein